MDVSVFDLFEEEAYTYLVVSRGEIYGNMIDSTTNATGVFKLRNGMISANNQESRQSDATLHIHPSEPFASTDMVGNGVRKDGLDYEIIGQTGGKNFHTGELEHYRLTLQRSDFVEETS